MEHHFDALVNVAAHPIRAAQIHFRFTAISKHENAAVLEKSANHAAYANPAADPAYAGTQGTSPADDELNIDAGLRRTVEGLNNLLV